MKTGWRLGVWHFAPGRWPTVAAALLFPGLCALGFWQLDRADQKLRLQQHHDAQVQAPMRVLDNAPVEARDVLFRRVMAHGRYDVAHEFLLDNRVHQGQVGYQVITPLRLAGSDRLLLVNRGWVALGRDRRDLPRTEAPRGEVTVQGVAVLPSAPGLRLGPAFPEGETWPRVWQYLDIAGFARRTNASVLPVLLELAPEGPGGFVRQWARHDRGVAMHQGYALTWFSLAAVLAVLYILLNTQKISKRQP